MDFRDQGNHQAENFLLADGLRRYLERGAYRPMFVHVGLDDD